MSKRVETTALGALALACASLLFVPKARAGEFDARGGYRFGDAAIVLDFEDELDPETDRWLPDDAPPPCLEPAYERLAGEDALSGEHYLHVATDILEGCAERFVVSLPEVVGSYRASLWVRHGNVDAQMTVIYPEGESALQIAKLGATGRVTSDGWMELASNDFTVDGTRAEAVYLRVFDYDTPGSDIDALEIVPSGEPWVDKTCSGARDTSCGAGSVCIHNRCRLGRLYVPPAPVDEIRSEVVDRMQSLLRVFFGGRKTRLEDLPKALAQLDELRHERDPWAFWSGWGRAIRLLHDWHTSASSGLAAFDRRARLNACFIEGDADKSQAAWPKHPQYKDILVSHTGSDGTQGLSQGDRLVAVDGQHPVAWARGLVDIDWGYWHANDADVHTELVERMRGLILAYAHSFDVIHCNAGDQTCDTVPEHYVVADLPDDSGQHVRCDNRPFYHYADGSTPGSNHSVGFNFYRGRVVEATEEQAVYGLLWDTLSGNGEPNGFVNGNLKNAFADFKANARGVILDHRAGNGGTLDGAETATQLVRPRERVLVFTSPIEVAGFTGPHSPEEGIALFERFDNASMWAGSDDYDPDMPVALLIHRDGSASDFFPFALKGAPKARIFGPAPTAGAFSTFYNFELGGGLALQLASGDSIAADGTPLIGRGVEPDVVVLQKQSDLLLGKDTVHEAALAWVLTELKP
jgi:hypothetical protein